MSLEVGPLDKIRCPSDDVLRAWLRRNGGTEYRKDCGKVHAALIESPGITFSELAEHLDRPCDPAVRGKLVSLAYLGLVFQMEGLWYPLDDEYIGGLRAVVLGGCDG